MNDITYWFWFGEISGLAIGIFWGMMIWDIISRKIKRKSK